jgi:EAL domain-containing protein (putative c-di-GMP-specific phosphodiesterase class I)
MRFDYVKIDGEFIRRLTESHVDQLVVKSMIEIARGLGKRTIAEFVEDVAALRLLGEYGVDYAQGFYLGWPAPLAMLRSDDVARLTGTAPVTALSSPRSPRSRPARAAP